MGYYQFPQPQSRRKTRPPELSPLVPPNSALAPSRVLPIGLEDCCDQDEDETHKGWDYSQYVERSPAITKLLPVVR
jgi:hypothetical protein